MAPVNRGTRLETDLQSQASSPAQDDSEEGEHEGADRGEQPTPVSAKGEQTGGEQAGKNGGACVWGSEERNAGEQSSDNQGSRSEKAGERPPQFKANHEHHEDDAVMTGSEDERWGSSDEDEGERPVEADDNEPSNEQASQWLKAILPEMTNGWWDVYPKGRGFAVKFCWRDPERQTLTFPRISYEQFQTLKQSAPDEVEKSTYAQISAHLRSLSLNPAKRDKALTVARKLGIDLDEYQITDVED
jgi:hypothetical protein